jgi:Kef-type K+ transport system membrane component KefB
VGRRRYFLAVLTVTTVFDVFLIFMAFYSRDLVDNVFYGACAIFTSINLVVAALRGPRTSEPTHDAED